MSNSARKDGGPPNPHRRKFLWQFPLALGTLAVTGELLTACGGEEPSTPPPPTPQLPPEEELSAILEDMAHGLIYRENGISLGARFLAGLEEENGEIVARIYNGSWGPAVARTNELAQGYYRLEEGTNSISETLETHAITAFSRILPEVSFTFVDNPAEADIIIQSEPFARSGTRDTGKTLANSVLPTEIEGRYRAIINLNTAQTDLQGWINEDNRVYLESLLMNEFFNAGLAVLDYEKLTPLRMEDHQAKMNLVSTLIARGSGIDEFTITRSNGPEDDNVLKRLDIMIRDTVWEEGLRLRQEQGQAVPRRNSEAELADAFENAVLAGAGLTA